MRRDGQCGLLDGHPLQHQQQVRHHQDRDAQEIAEAESGADNREYRAT
ncbi:MAG TPA: hypothetical protein VMF03_10350 [Steroidobacteraceae bacterium]|nr:hypothetical protein [Steroidobacteraceae bacterium]